MSTLRLQMALCATVAFLLPSSLFSGVVFQDGFESGTIGASWQVMNSYDGRATVTTNHAPASGDWHLVLDDSVNDAVDSAASVTIEIDVAHRQNVILEYKAKSLGNEPNGWYYGTSFRGLPWFDCVAVSADEGANWRVIHELASLGADWEIRYASLDEYIYWTTQRPSKLWIRFAEYDNASAPIDGIAIDDVVIRAEEVQQIVLELPGSVREGDGPFTGYVMLDRPHTNSLVVSLSESITNQLVLPASVEIPAGETWAQFSFSPVNDNRVNLARELFISASFDGAFASRSLMILDDETPVPTLALPAQVIEGGSAATNGWVFFDRAPEVPLELWLSSDPMYQVNLNMPITFAAGQTSAVFLVEASEDDMIETPVSVEVTTVYPGMTPAKAQIMVLDNDVASLALELPEFLVEGTSGEGMVHFSGYLATNVTVTLTTTNSQSLSLPMTIGSYGGALSFQVTALDNLVRDGNRSVWVTASANGFPSATAKLTILDNEVGTYLVEVPADLMDISEPMELSVAAAGVGGNLLANFVGDVILEVILSNGSTLPVSPSSIHISGETGWSGAVQLPPGLQGILRIRARDAAGLSGDSRPFEMMRSLNESFADLVWDPVRSRFYATIGADQGTNGNQVVAIDPATAQVTHRLPLAQNPGQLALTSGGEKLYVVANANGTIARINLSSMTIENVFAVGTSPVYGTLYAADICAVAGQPDLLVVAQKRENYYDPYIAVAVYENGLPRALAVNSPQGGADIEASADPNVFFARSSSGIKRLAINSSGITEVQANGNLLKQYELDIHSDGDWLLASDGVLVDGANLLKLGWFPGTSMGCLNRGAHRAYFLEQAQPWLPRDEIAAYEATLFSRLVSMKMSREFDEPKSFIRWGENGLAFLTQTNLVWLSSVRLVPSGQPSDLSLTMHAAPDPAMVGSPLVYSITVSNKGPNIAPGSYMNVTLSDGQTPQEVSISSGSSSVVDGLLTVDFGPMAAGQAVSVSITANPDTAGALSCTAVVSSQAPDPDPANNAASVFLQAGVQTPLDAVNVLRLNANNLVYDAGRGVIWASVPALGNDQYSGILVAVDPATGLTTQSVPLQRDPMEHCMALSPNGRYLFVGCRNMSEMARVDLSTTPPTVAHLQLGSSFGAAADVEPLEGDGTSFIAVSGYKVEAFVFDGATQRPAGVQTGRIEKGGAPGLFIGYLDWQSKLSQLIVNSSGIVSTQENALVLANTFEIKGDGGLVLSSSGRLVDSSTLLLKANFETIGLPCLDVAAHRAYIASGESLLGFDTQTFFPTGEFSLPQELQYYSTHSLIRWGQDGFALGTASGRVYIGRWGAISFNTDSDSDWIADQWELSWFNTLDGSPSDDQDCDGLCNAMEYLYCTSPIEASPSPMQVSVTTDGGQKNMRLVFPRRAGLSPMPYTYQASADLTTWAAPANLTETVLGTTTQKGVLIETVEVLMPASNPVAGFLRFGWGVSAP